MRMYTVSRTNRNRDLSDEIQFENTLLRNGIISPSVEEKLANIYDNAYRDAADSMLDTLSIYTASDLFSDVNNSDECKDPIKAPAPRHSNKDGLVYAFTTSTPLRSDCNVYAELFAANVNLNNEKGTYEATEEVKRPEDLLSGTLLRTQSTKTCLPKIRKSMKKLKRCSKKGAATALTVILTNIL